MTWAHFVLAGIVVLIAAGILWKRHLKRRLDDIDGLGGVQKRGTGEDVNVIASFGDDAEGKDSQTKGPKGG